jgi:hypothetical protein
VKIMTRKIEVFTADCPLCKDTLRIIREAACTDCEVIERRCAGDDCGCAPAQEYNIRAVPTVVVDGKIALVGKPTPEEAQAIFTC